MPKTAAPEVRLHQQRRNQPFRKATRGVRQSGLNKPTLKDEKKAAVSCSFKKKNLPHTHVIYMLYKIQL